MGGLQGEAEEQQDAKDVGDTAFLAECRRDQEICLVTRSSSIEIVKLISSGEDEAQ
jgi:hypothetical protein